MARYRLIIDPETKTAIYKSLASALCLSFLFYSSGAYAATAVPGVNAAIPNLATMLTNFATAVPNLMRLVTASAYVMGLFFIIQAVMGMKHLGEMRTMQSREHGFWGPAIEFLVGSALLYLPSTVQSVMGTLWVSTNPYAYVSDSTSNAAFIDACYGVVQLIGTIAFVRGLIILHNAGGERSDPHAMGKAASHLLGGILCINIYGTLQMFEATVGMIS
jgi:intracellular multiplication protein IcmC